MMKNGTCNHDKIVTILRSALVRFKLWKKENEDFPKSFFFFNFPPKILKLKNKIFFYCVVANFLICQ